MGRLLTSLFLFVIATAPAGAQGPAISLSAAVDAAWARSPEARELTARAREWAARGEQAEAWVAGPGSASLGQTRGRGNPDRGKAEWELELAWPLWLPGQREARLTLADREGAALAARRQALRGELAGEVGRRHAAWQLAVVEAELAASRAEAARRLEADLERRLAVGEAARFDANLARAERLAAETAAAEAALAAEGARGEWRLLTGLEIAPEQALLLPAGPPPGAAEPAALAAARQAEAAAAARLRAELATSREAPELALRVLRERDAGEPWGDQVGLRLTLPFGGGAGWRAATAAAEAEQARALASLAAEERRAALARQQADAEATLADTALAGAMRRQQLARDNLGLADRAYRLGQFDVATLLRARGAALEAALEVRRIEGRRFLARLQQLLASGVEL